MSSPTELGTGPGAPLTALRGVGPRRAELLARDLGVRTLGELVHVLPRRYDEPGRSAALAELEEGQVARVRVVVRGPRSGAGVGARP